MNMISKRACRAMVIASQIGPYIELILERRNGLRPCLKLIELCLCATILPKHSIERDFSHGA